MPNSTRACAYCCSLIAFQEVPAKAVGKCAERPLGQTRWPGNPLGPRSQKTYPTQRNLPQTTPTPTPLRRLTWVCSTKDFQTTRQPSFNFKPTFQAGRNTGMSNYANDARGTAAAAPRRHRNKVGGAEAHCVPLSGHPTAVPARAKAKGHLLILFTARWTTAIFF